MRYPIFRCIGCLLAILFATCVHAQKDNKKAKEKKTRSVDMVAVYRKKTIAFTFTRAEYNHFRDSINHQTKDALHKVNDHKIEWRQAKIVANVQDSLQQEDMYFVYRGEEFLYILEKEAYRQFRDSISGSTKDTLFVYEGNRVEIHDYDGLSRPNRPNRLPAVFTNKQGYVSIALPLAKTHHYRIVFFADAVQLFEMDPVKETSLILDKTNFIHAGWFRYELYDGNRLVERNKFFLPK